MMMPPAMPLCCEENCQWSRLSTYRKTVRCHWECALTRIQQKQLRAHTKKKREGYCRPQCHHQQCRCCCCAVLPQGRGLSSRCARAKARTWRQCRPRGKCTPCTQLDLCRRSRERSSSLKAIAPLAPRKK